MLGSRCLRGGKRPCESPECGGGLPLCAKAAVGPGLPGCAGPAGRPPRPLRSRRGPGRLWRAGHPGDEPRLLRTPAVPARPTPQPHPGPWPSTPGQRVPGCPGREAGSHQEALGPGLRGGAATEGRLSQGSRARRGLAEAPGGCPFEATGSCTTAGVYARAFFNKMPGARLPPTATAPAFQKGQGLAWAPGAGCGGGKGRTRVRPSREPPCTRVPGPGHSGTKPAGCQAPPRPLPGQTQCTLRPQNRRPGGTASAAPNTPARRRQSQGVLPIGSSRSSWAQPVVPASQAPSRTGDPGDTHPPRHTAQGPRLSVRKQNQPDPSWFGICPASFSPPAPHALLSVPREPGCRARAAGRARGQTSRRRGPGRPCPARPHGGPS